jgi:hypothetical protein
MAIAAAVPAAAEIAVFADGRILKVEDAYLADHQIVLDLVGGGRMVVPAVRIQRVVADEIEPAATAPELPGECRTHWMEEPLPEDVPFRSAIVAAARSVDLHPALLVALVAAESNFDPRAVSRVGAMGLTQLMPAAAADQGVSEPFDPEANLAGGARHLRSLLDRFRSLTLALAAYNAGATTVERFGGVPPYRETQSYVRRILDAFCGDRE